MTVQENLLLGGYVQAKKSRSTADSEIGRVYELFPVLKERAKQLAGTLSGGEQQMLAMGRALMAKPSLIMMDVEQNAKAALGIADRGYVLETGKIILQGAAEDLLENRDVQRAYLGREMD
jgi:branched-chain amino acid transport system ATP-binding protein